MTATTRRATTVLRGGTRASPLARWQTARVSAALKDIAGCDCQEILITTEGDRRLEQPLPEIGGKGLFTEALESALRRGAIDFAVHSLKDLPVDEPDGLVVGAVWQRADPRDVVIAASRTPLAALPAGAVVGTSSLRREAQLRALRPDVNVRSLRGNVDTRVKKACKGQYDAILLAGAGLVRLGLQDYISQWLPLDAMYPAPGQGALAVQCRVDDGDTRRLLIALEDTDTRRAVSAERAFSSQLDAGCSLPVGAYALVQEESIDLNGIVVSLDGKDLIRVREVGQDPEAVGATLAAQALAQGAAGILAGKPSQGGQP